MLDYIEGTDRGQMTLFPDRLEAGSARIFQSASLIFLWSRSILQDWAMVVCLRRRRVGRGITHRFC